MITINNKRKNNIYFSVILTTYNSEKYVRNALISIYQQKFKKFEIILVDDGSSDNTIEIAKKYKNQNKNKIRIFSLNHLGIPARSRNFGIKKAKGTHLCFLDCDDLYDYDIFYHDVILHNNGKKKLLNCKKIDNHNSFNDLLLKGNKIVLSSSCVKKSFLEKKKIKFNENKNYISVEDYDFWIKLAKKGGKFILIEKVLGIYNLNNSSISKKRIIHFLNTFFILRSYQKFIKNNFLKLSIRKLRIIISFLKLSIFEKNYKLFIFLVKFIFILGNHK
jgi:glycosyltransferase involved in cell wall biosynthesis